MKIIKFIISFFSRTINIVGVIILMLCLSASYISPTKISIIPLFGFVFPVLVIINIIFVVIWILRKRWFFLVSLIALLISSPQIFNIVAFGKDEPIEGESFKVMSYNVRNFDLYNWSENVEAQAKIFETIKDENPDIICFQEFYSDTSKNFNTIKKLKNLGYKHYFFAKELVLKNSNEWGIATFSKFPIVDSKNLLKQETESFYGTLPYKCIYTDIKIKEKNIRVFNVHLQSIHFGKDEYQLINDVKNNADVEEQAAKNLIKKLMKGFQKRAGQAETLKEILKQQTLPYMVCGDFNDLPNSYVYNLLSKNMNDAFLENNKGIGRTFNKNIPFLRIDYILSSKPSKSSNFRVIDNEISDHFPIVANVAF